MTFITLTGADNQTDLDLLWDLAHMAGPDFVEWGILYSELRQGMGRHPTFDWIEALTRRIEADRSGAPAFALHVCGRAVNDFLDGKGRVYELSQAFGRVQVNFIAPNHDLAMIRRMLARESHRTIITAHNRANRHLWADLLAYPNHALLFDGSEGRGISPSEWPEPMPAVPCGYAGGLGPDNLEAELHRIDRAAGGRPYWVDMEGKLRGSDDHFDLDRVRSCVAIAQRFVAARPEGGAVARLCADNERLRRALPVPEAVDAYECPRSA